MEPVEIVLTHLELHVTEPRKPHGLARQIGRAVRSGKPGKATSRGIALKADGTFSIEIARASFEAELAEEARRIGRPIRVLAPKSGLPVYAGKDLLGYLTAHDMKR